MRRLLRACLVLSLLLIVASLLSSKLIYAHSSLNVDEKTLTWAQQSYGSKGMDRLLHWQQFMVGLGTDELELVEAVNSYLNHYVFISDIHHWGKPDYWATPVEFIASGGGDCEDFAVAKYFSLIQLGVASDKLALNYVFATPLNQSHLVLAYYPLPGREPWILDNIINTIKPASERSDLVPIYSFNASTLWKNKKMGKGERIGHSRRIRPWRELLHRMEEL
nr:transglutaminase-like cysteine peptidase [uncultured Desulfobulbus sp.]